MMLDFDPRFYLETAGGMPDEEIDLALCALAFSLFNYEGLSSDRYFHHLKRLAEEVKVRYAALLLEGSEDDVYAQIAALKHVLADDYGYSGDQDRYNDLQNADLVRVIDRARGVPILLTILYMHAARAQGWHVSGLNMPRHFLCKISKDGQSVIFDPFHDCRVWQAQDLRSLVKQNMGDEAELSADYYAPCSNREILVRLQNNIKYRLIDMEDYNAALKLVRLMRLFHPAEFRLLFDEGVLCARTERPRDAITALEAYIERVPDAREKHDAAMLLNQVKDSLH